MKMPINDVLYRYSLPSDFFDNGSTSTNATEESKVISNSLGKPDTDNCIIKSVLTFSLFV